MSLQDCAIATSTETVDPTMSAGSLAFAPGVVTAGNAQLAAIAATWALITNPYVGGIIFEYGPLDGSAARTTTALQSAALMAWSATDGVASGKTYSVRYRAASSDLSVKGPWSDLQNVVAGVLGIIPAQPGATEWSAMGTTITGGGVSTPVVLLTGAVAAANVTGVYIEIADHGGTNWTPFGTYLPTMTRLPIDSVGSTQVVDVGITYIGTGGTGTRRVIDNGGSGYTAGAFSTGVTPDPTPAAVNWANMATTSGAIPVSSTNADQTITAINEPITLKLTWTGAATMQYVLNGGAPTSITSGNTFIVNNGDAVHFIAGYNTVGSTSGTATVVNVTDSNTTLDTFTYNLTGAATVADGTQQVITATGAYSFTIPSNWLGFIDIEGDAGGQAGGEGGTLPSGGDYLGRGAGQGGHFKHHMAVVPGTTVVAGTVGAGATAVSGTKFPSATPGGDTTVTSPALTAHGGYLSAGVGLGGTCSGANVANTTGRNGGLMNISDGGGIPDQTTLRTDGNAPGGGGSGGDVGFFGGNGADGQIIITARTV